MRKPSWMDFYKDVCDQCVIFQGALIDIVATRDCPGGTTCPSGGTIDYCLFNSDGMFRILCLSYLNYLPFDTFTLKYDPGALALVPTKVSYSN